MRNPKTTRTVTARIVPGMDYRNRITPKTMPIRQVDETREEYYKRCGDSHTWDGPEVLIHTAMVPTCSVCGIDASEYGVMCHVKTN